MSIKKNGIPKQDTIRNSSSKSGLFEILRTNFVDGFYERILNASTDGVFKAVCLSGLRTEDNTGVSLDSDDAIERDGYLYITVRPLDPTLSATLSKTENSTSLEECLLSIRAHTSVFTARSDFKIENTNIPSFGQILNCYFENGSIINSDFSGLRFSKPIDKEEIHPDFVRLMSLQLSENPQNAFDNGAPALLGEDEFVGPPMPTDQDQKMQSFEEKLRQEFAKQSIPFHVVSSSRTPERQAQILKSIYDKQGRGEIISKYRIGNQIVAAIESGDNEKLIEIAPDTTKHIGGMALDLRTYNLTDEQVKKALKIIKDLGGRTLLEPIEKCWEKSGSNVTDPKRLAAPGGTEGAPCFREHIHLDIPENWNG